MNEPNPQEDEPQAVWHSKEVENGIRQIIKLCNQPILARDKQRDAKIAHAVRGIIDAAISEGVDQMLRQYAAIELFKSGVLKKGIGDE